MTDIPAPQAPPVPAPPAEPKPNPFARIIGVATHVVENGRDVPIGRRPKHSLAVSALKVRRRIERMVRRAH